MHRFPGTSKQTGWSRRGVLRAAVGVPLALSQGMLTQGLPGPAVPSRAGADETGAAQAAEGAGGRAICAFVKFLQSLSYDQLADTIAELGFAGIEATVRPGGQVLPERVRQDLPRLVAALRKRNLEVTVMTTAVTRADDSLNERVLKTAADLGIRRYRMGYYRYDRQRPLPEQLEALKPVVAGLAALNRTCRLTALYQNHAGAAYVGASVWDIYQLFKDHPREQLSLAFDVRHATVEGGLTWPTLFRLAEPHLGAVYAKDFKWQGRQPQNVPLGTGQVDPAFFALLRRSAFDGPISLHVEYLPQAGVDANVAALRRDARRLRELLAGRGD